MLHDNEFKVQYKNKIPIKNSIIFSSSEEDEQVDSEEVVSNRNSVDSRKYKAEDRKQLLLELARLRKMEKEKSSSLGRRTRNSLTRSTIEDREDEEVERYDSSDDEEDFQPTLMDKPKRKSPRRSQRSTTSSSQPSEALDAATLKISQRKQHTQKQGKRRVSEQRSSGDESEPNIKRKSRRASLAASRLQESSTVSECDIKEVLSSEESEVDEDELVPNTKRKVPVIEFESEEEKEEKREKIKNNLKKLMRKRTGDYTSSDEDAGVDEEVVQSDSDDVKEKSRRASVSSASGGRVMRSMGTEPEIMELPSDTATPSEDSAQEDKAKAKKRHRKRQKKTKRRHPKEDYVVGESDDDILETDLENIYNTEDEFEDPTAGETLYCHECGEYKVKDDFSVVQQREGGLSRHCLLHTWTGGRIKADDYMTVLDEKLLMNKRLLKRQEEWYGLNEKGLGESEYEEDDWLVKDDDDDAAAVECDSDSEPVEIFPKAKGRERKRSNPAVAIDDSD